MRISLTHHKRRNVYNGRKKLTPLLGGRISECFFLGLSVLFRQYPTMTWFLDGQFGLPTRPALFFLWAGIRLYLRICFASIFPLWMFLYLFFPAQHFLVNWNKKKKREENGVSCGWPVMKEERVLFRKLISFYAFLLFLSLPGTLGFLLVFSSCDGTRAVSKRSSESYNLAGGKSTRPNAVYIYTRLL
jgi:hypothetical protein